MSTSVEPQKVAPRAWSAGRESAAARRSGVRLRRFRLGLAVTDLLLVAAAVGIAQFTRFGFAGANVEGSEIRYASLSAALVVAWTVALVSRGAYRKDVLGHGTKEFVLTVTASVQLFAFAALLSYALRYQLARGYVLIALPLGILLLLLNHWLWRRRLVRLRQRGELSVRVLAVGDSAHIAQLVEATDREPGAGFRVDAVCSDESSPDGTVAGRPVVGRELQAPAVVATGAYDLVAWAGSRSGPDALKRLGWSLEGTRTGLVVLPGLIDIAGPRLSATPVSGLPLLYVERPTFSGPKLIAKLAMDYVLSTVLLILLLPLWAVTAAAIWLDDRGPLFYRQERIGQNGRPFKIWKFRSMFEGADAQEEDLREGEHDGAGLLFKDRDDPRITRVGRVIRWFSIDETPQLLNVLSGQMSLVGPRPPLPKEVAGYENDVRRRLLVRPGATGLWQINGRSDLSWQESVRLDLYYVENWSVLGDLVILGRTVGAVLHGRGAY